MCYGDIDRDLCEKNNIKADDITVEHVNKTKKGASNASLRITSEVYQMFMDTKKVFLGLQRCRVRDDFNLRRCWKCNAYGHAAKKCNRAAVCGVCAGPHETRDCSNPKEQACINCRISNKYCKTEKKKHTGHTESDIHRCEVYKTYWEKTVAKTNYPSKPEMYNIREAATIMTCDEWR